MRIITLFVCILISLPLYAQERIRVKGVMLAGGDTIVIINNGIYREGDKYGKYEVAEILDEGVVLEHKGQPVFYEVKANKILDYKPFKLEYAFSRKHGQPKEYYEAIKYWTWATEADSYEELIMMHKLAIKNAEAAAPKVDALKRAKLVETVHKARKYIAALKVQEKLDLDKDDYIILNLQK